MFQAIKGSNKIFAVRVSARMLVFLLSFSLIFSPSLSMAQTLPLLGLPAPGMMVSPTPLFEPIHLKGITIYPDEPLRFDFIIDKGNTTADLKEVEKESERLLKYFLAALTIPDDDLWVNLSPYEQERIIPEDLGNTELGRDLLAQDYLLKQLTASFIHPDKDLGKKFWDEIYKKAYEKFGTTNIPMDTFNKVWILPERATVFENGNHAYVVESSLKVMLDHDYRALDENKMDTNSKESELSQQIVREIILPEIEKEVNEGENFAPLRQIYNSLILAKWYKETIKDSLLSQVYLNQNKTLGVDVEDKDIKNKIYSRYIEAYKKGVFNYIKEDIDLVTKEPIPRKYFSGGMSRLMKFELGRTANRLLIDSDPVGKYTLIVSADPQKEGITNKAMLSFDDTQKQMVGRLVHRDLQREELADADIDVLMIPGNDDIRIFEEVLTLFSEGVGKHILISGGVGRLTEPLQKAAQERGFDIQSGPEAVMIRDIMVKLAEQKPEWNGMAERLMDDDVVILEPEARYTIENFEKAGELLRARGLIQEGTPVKPLKILYAQKPLQQLRTVGGFNKVFEKDIAEGRVEGVSYTVDYTPEESTAVDIIGEAYRILVNFQKGDVTYPQDLGILTPGEWSNARKIYGMLPIGEREKFSGDMLTLSRNLGLTREDVMKDLAGETYQFATTVYDKIGLSGIPAALMGTADSFEFEREERTFRPVALVERSDYGTLEAYKAALLKQRDYLRKEVSSLLREAGELNSEQSMEGAEADEAIDRINAELLKILLEQKKGMKRAEQLTVTNPDKRNSGLTFRADDFSRTAAEQVGRRIVQLQKELDRDVNMVFATGNTMKKFLQYLAVYNETRPDEEKIDWGRIQAFHLDEYAGLDRNHYASFAKFLNDNLFSRVPIPKNNIHYVADYAAEHGEDNLSVYTDTLKAKGGADIVMLGIGRDGHLAFNEPPQFSNFDSRIQKVELTEETIVDNEPDYKEIRDNPYAYTMGMADIFEGRHIFFLANKPKKASIVHRAFLDDVTEDVPASLLQRHDNVTMILDSEAASSMVKYASAELSMGLKKYDNVRSSSKYSDAKAKLLKRMESMDLAGSVTVQDAVDFDTFLASLDLNDDELKALLALDEKRAAKLQKNGMVALDFFGANREAGLLLIKYDKGGEFPAHKHNAEAYRYETYRVLKGNVRTDVLKEVAGPEVVKGNKTYVRLRAVDFAHQSGYTNQVYSEPKSDTDIHQPVNASDRHEAWILLLFVQSPEVKAMEKPQAAAALSFTKYFPVDEKTIKEKKLNKDGLVGVWYERKDPVKANQAMLGDDDDAAQVPQSIRNFRDWFLSPDLGKREQARREAARLPKAQLRKLVRLLRDTYNMTREKSPMEENQDYYGMGLEDPAKAAASHSALDYLEGLLNKAMLADTIDFESQAIVLLKRDETVTPPDAIRQASLFTNKRVVVFDDGLADVYAGQLIKAIKEKNENVFRSPRGIDNKPLSHQGTLNFLKEIAPDVIIAPDKDKDVMTILGLYANRFGKTIDVLFYPTYERETQAPLTGQISQQVNLSVAASEEFMAIARHSLRAHQSQLPRDEYFNRTDYEAAAVHASAAAAKLSDFWGLRTQQGPYANNFVVAHIGNDGRLVDPDPAKQYQIVFGSQKPEEGFLTIRIDDASEIAVSSPHPDDMEIAAPLLVLNALDNGAEVHNIIHSTGKNAVMDDDPLVERAIVQEKSKRRVKHHLRTEEAERAGERLEAALFNGGLVHVSNMKLDILLEDSDRLTEIMKQELIKAQFERVLKRHKQKSPSEPFVVVLAHPLDSHPSHRDTTRRDLEVLKELAEEHDTDITLLYYLAPWAGDYNTYFHYPEDSVVELPQGADKTKAAMIGDILDSQARGLTPLTAELTGKFGVGGIPYKEMGGDKVERYRRARINPGVNQAMLATYPLRSDDEEVAGRAARRFVREGEKTISKVKENRYLAPHILTVSDDVLSQYGKATVAHAGIALKLENLREIVKKHKLHYSDVPADKEVEEAEWFVEIDGRIYVLDLLADVEGSSKKTMQTHMARKRAGIAQGESIQQFEVWTDDIQKAKDDILKVAYHRKSNSGDPDSGLIRVSTKIETGANGTQIFFVMVALEDGSKALVELVQRPRPKDIGTAGHDDPDMWRHFPGSSKMAINAVSGLIAVEGDVYAQPRWASGGAIDIKTNREVTPGASGGWRYIGTSGYIIINDKTGETATRNSDGRFVKDKDRTVNTLIDGVSRGDENATGQLISLIEQGGDNIKEILRKLDTFDKRLTPQRVGITGAAGVGKSTLVEAMINEYRAQGKKIAVLGIDPTSPATGGAILADRLRLDPELVTDDDVYYRSLATRGGLGGIARMTESVAKVFDVFGNIGWKGQHKDVLLIETEGVAQSQQDIRNITDTVVAAIVPGMNRLTMMKDSYLDVADVLVVNKSDRNPELAQQTALVASDVFTKKRGGDRAPPVLQTSALQESAAGIDALLTAIDEHKSFLDGGKTPLTPPSQFFPKPRGKVLSLEVGQYDRSLGLAGQLKDNGLEVVYLRQEEGFSTWTALMLTAIYEDVQAVVIDISDKKQVALIAKMAEILEKQFKIKTWIRLRGEPVSDLRGDHYEIFDDKTLDYAVAEVISNKVEAPDVMADAEALLTELREINSRDNGDNPIRAARLMSQLERSSERVLSQFLAGATDVKRAHRIGFTGPPGVGKSTLIGKTARHLKELGLKVSVVMVDPSSRKSGGALLIDRYRLDDIALDRDINVRSIALRDSQTGIAVATEAAVRAMEAQGVDIVIVESEGTGQSQEGLGKIVDTRILTVAPSSLGDIQTMKAGSMEALDISVLNQGDTEGAFLAMKDLEAGITMHARSADDWQPRAVRVSAVEEKGLPELVQAIAHHIAHVAEIEANKAMLSERRDAIAEKLRKAKVEVETWGVGDKSGALDIQLGEVEDAQPGKFPFTGGIFPSYRDHPKTGAKIYWTPRQYAGSGTTDETNERFLKIQREAPIPAFSLAFSNSTQVGIDSTDKRAIYNIGEEGAPIDHIGDLRKIFEGIDILNPKVSLSMTINASAFALEAMYIGLAIERLTDETNTSEHRQAALKWIQEELRGGDTSGGAITEAEAEYWARTHLRFTVQNDNEKERTTRNNYGISEAGSRRLTNDMLDYNAGDGKHPTFINTLSISGYHMAEAGATAEQEAAFTLRNGYRYAKTFLEDQRADSTVTIDQLLSQFSFFFDSKLFEETGEDFVHQVAKFRATRRLWAKIAKQLGAEKTKALSLRFHTQTSGLPLRSDDTGLEEMLNIMRILFEGLAAIYGGTQTLHIDAYDEATNLPTDHSAGIAIESHKILRRVLGDTMPMDPLHAGGTPLLKKHVEALKEEGFALIRREMKFKGKEWTPALEQQVKDAIQTEVIDKLGPLTNAKNRLIQYTDQIERDALSLMQTLIRLDETDGPDATSSFVRDTIQDEVMRTGLLREERLAKEKNAGVVRKPTRQKKASSITPQQLEDKMAPYSKRRARVISELEAFKAQRDKKALDSALGSLKAAAKGEDNLISIAIRAARAEATVGEMMSAVIDVFGNYKKGVFPSKTTPAKQASKVIKSDRPIRFLIGKPGLDGHDRGLNLVSAALKNAGIETIYAGIRQTPEMLARAAVQEDADFIGISSLSGARLHFVQDLMSELKRLGADKRINVIVGGITEDDGPYLKKLGVKEVFDPSHGNGEIYHILDYLQSWADRNINKREIENKAMLTGASLDEIMEFIRQEDFDGALEMLADLKSIWSPREVSALHDQIRGRSAEYNLDENTVADFFDHMAEEGLDSREDTFDSEFEPNKAMLGSQDDDDGKDDSKPVGKKAVKKATKKKAVKKKTARKAGAKKPAVKKAVKNPQGEIPASEETVDKDKAGQGSAVDKAPEARRINERRPATKSELLTEDGKVRPEVYLKPYRSQMTDEAQSPVEFMQAWIDQRRESGGGSSEELKILTLPLAEIIHRDVFVVLAGFLSQVPIGETVTLGDIFQNRNVSPTRPAGIFRDLIATRRFEVLFNAITILNTAETKSKDGFKLKSSAFKGGQTKVTVLGKPAASGKRPKPPAESREQRAPQPEERPESLLSMAVRVVEKMESQQPSEWSDDDLTAISQLSDNRDRLSEPLRERVSRILTISTANKAMLAEGDPSRQAQIRLELPREKLVGSDPQGRQWRAIEIDYQGDRETFDGLGRVLRAVGLVKGDDTELEAFLIRYPPEFVYTGNPHQMPLTMDYAILVFGHQIFVEIQGGQFPVMDYLWILTQRLGKGGFDPKHDDPDKIVMIDPERKIYANLNRAIIHNPDEHYFRLATRHMIINPVDAVGAVLLLESEQIKPNEAMLAEGDEAPTVWQQVAERRQAFTARFRSIMGEKDSFTAKLLTSAMEHFGVDEDTRERIDEYPERQRALTFAVSRALHFPTAREKAWLDDFLQREGVDVSSVWQQADMDIFKDRNAPLPVNADVRHDDEKKEAKALRRFLGGRLDVADWNNVKMVLDFLESPGIVAKEMLDEKVLPMARDLEYSEFVNLLHLLSLFMEQRYLSGGIKGTALESKFAEFVFKLFVKYLTKFNDSQPMPGEVVAESLRLIQAGQGPQIKGDWNGSGNGRFGPLTWPELDAFVSKAMLGAKEVDYIEIIDLVIGGQPEEAIARMKADRNKWTMRSVGELEIRLSRKEIQDPTTRDAVDGFHARLIEEGFDAVYFEGRNQAMMGSIPVNPYLIENPPIIGAIRDKLFEILDRQTETATELRDSVKHLFRQIEGGYTVMPPSMNLTFVIQIEGIVRAMLRISPASDSDRELTNLMFDVLKNLHKVSHRLDPQNKPSFPVDWSKMEDSISPEGNFRQFLYRPTPDSRPAGILAPVRKGYLENEKKPGARAFVTLISEDEQPFVDRLLAAQTILYYLDKSGSFDSEVFRYVIARQEGADDARVHIQNFALAWAIAENSDIGLMARFNERRDTSLENLTMRIRNESLWPASVTAGQINVLAEYQSQPVPLSVIRFLLASTQPQTRMLTQPDEVNQTAVTALSIIYQRLDAQSRRVIDGLSPGFAEWFGDVPPGGNGIIQDMAMLADDTGTLGRREFLGAMAVGAAAVALPGIGSAGPQRAQRKGDDWRNYSSRPTLESAKATFEIAAEWLREHNYPHMDIIDAYMMGARKAKADTKGHPASKDVDSSRPGDMVIHLNPEIIHRNFTNIQTSQSEDMFVEVHVAAVVREAWGAWMISNYPNWYDKAFQYKKELMTGLQRVQSQGPRAIEDYMIGQWDKVVHIISETFAAEYFEVQKQMEFMFWAADNRLYSKENADRDAQRVSDEIWRQNHQFFGYRYAYRDSPELFSLEMALMLANVLNTKRRGINTDGTANDWFNYYFLEQRRYRDSNGAVGLEPGLAQRMLEGEPVSPEKIARQIQYLYPIVKQLLDTRLGQGQVPDGQPDEGDNTLRNLLIAGGVVAAGAAAYWKYGRRSEKDIKDEAMLAELIVVASVASAGAGAGVYYWRNHTVNGVISRLDNLYGDELESAIRFLGQKGDMAAKDPLIKLYTSRRIPLSTFEALEFALGQLSVSFEDREQAYIDALPNAHLAVAEQILDRLGQIKSVSAYKAIINNLTHTDYHVRKAVRKRIKELDISETLYKEKLIESYLLDLAMKNKGFVEPAATALAELGAQEAVEPLKALMTHRVESVRDAVDAALIKLGEESFVTALRRTEADVASNIRSQLTVGGDKVEYGHVREAVSIIEAGGTYTARYVPHRDPVYGDREEVLFVDSAGSETRGFPLISAGQSEGIAIEPDKAMLGEAQARELLEAQLPATLRRLIKSHHIREVIGLDGKFWLKYIRPVEGFLDHPDWEDWRQPAVPEDVEVMPLEGEEDLVTPTLNKGYYDYTSYVVDTIWRPMDTVTSVPQEKIERAVWSKYGPDNQPKDFPGFAVGTWFEQGGAIDIQLRGFIDDLRRELQDIQADDGQTTLADKIAFVNPDHLHMTAFNLVAGEAARAPGIEARLTEDVARAFRTLGENGSVDLKIRGAGTFLPHMPAIVAPVFPADEKSMESLYNVQKSLENSTGIRPAFPFIGFITLAYITSPMSERELEEFKGVMGSGFTVNDIGSFRLDDIHMRAFENMDEYGEPLISYNFGSGEVTVSGQSNQAMLGGQSREDRVRDLKEAIRRIGKGKRPRPWGVANYEIEQRRRHELAAEIHRVRGQAHKDLLREIIDLERQIAELQKYHGDGKFSEVRRLRARLNNLRSQAIVQYRDWAMLSEVEAEELIKGKLDPRHHHLIRSWHISYVQQLVRDGFDFNVHYVPESEKEYESLKTPGGYYTGDHGGGAGYMPGDDGIRTKPEDIYIEKVKRQSSQAMLSLYEPVYDYKTTRVEVQTLSGASFKEAVQPLLLSGWEIVAQEGPFTDQVYDIPPFYYELELRRLIVGPVPNQAMLGEAEAEALIKSKLDAKHHHLIKPEHIRRAIELDGEFDVVYEAPELGEPEWTGIGGDLGTYTAWPISDEGIKIVTKNRAMLGDDVRELVQTKIRKIISIQAGASFDDYSLKGDIDYELAQELFERDGDFEVEVDVFDEGSWGPRIYPGYDAVEIPTRENSGPFYWGSYRVTIRPKSEQSGANQAMLGEAEKGGIDLENIPVKKTGEGINVQFNPEAVAPILEMGIDGFAPVIINIVPVTNVYLLLGLEQRREDEEFEVSRLN